MIQTTGDRDSWGGGIWGESVFSWQFSVGSCDDSAVADYHRGESQWGGLKVSGGM